MKTYTYRTDSELSEVEAEGLAEALDEIAPTPKQIGDGAWAWVEDPDTGERLYVAEENMP